MEDDESDALKIIANTIFLHAIIKSGGCINIVFRNQLRLLIVAAGAWKTTVEVSDTT